MQSLELNQTVFRLTLAAAFAFGLLFAAVVHWLSRKHIIGQTAWAVVTGVTFTLAIMIPVFGIGQVAIMICYFIATGLPMIVEYLWRVQQDYEQDHEVAKGLAKEILNDRQAGDRQERV